MALTTDFRETVGARYQGDRKYRRGLLAGAVESLLAGEGALESVSGPSRSGGGAKRGVPKGGKPRAGSGAGYWRAAVGRKVLRDFINATISFPALAEKTGIHAKTLHQMFGPNGNPTAANLFRIIACLQEQESVRLKVTA